MRSGRWIFLGRAGQKNDSCGRNEDLGVGRRQASRDHFPALTWLSLVRLRPRRARLRFTRRGPVYRIGFERQGPPVPDAGLSD